MVKKYAIAMTALIWLAASTARASSFQHFDNGIDFWGEKPKAPDAEIQSVRKEKSDQKDKTQFDWNKHLDPANEEFFREGDHIPPEPFMELVRNPTDQNIRMWFSYIEKKNTLTQRLARRMEEYSRANQATLSQEEKTTITQNLAKIAVPEDDFERYRFRMYFDSNCPHCQKMFATLNDLQDRGYFVEARQVDRGPLQHVKSMVPIVAVSADEVKKFGVTAVPLLLIGDLKNKTVYRQTGFVTPEDVLTKLREK